jgi:hypothetical protein
LVARLGGFAAGGAAILLRALGCRQAVVQVNSMDTKHMPSGPMLEPLHNYWSKQPLTRCLATGVTARQLALVFWEVCSAGPMNR